MKLAFVGTSGGNVFMNELLGAVAHEVGRCGVETELVLDRFPDGEEAVYVVVPHEYFATAPEEDHPGEDELRRTIALCVEQPGTTWFELGLEHARRAAATVDIARQGVLELRRRGLAAEHFRLGYTDYWDRWKRDESTERSVDVVHMGTETARRLHALAACGEWLWPHQARVLLPPVEAKPGPRPDFLVGEAKLSALRSSKILLNLHRDDSPYFEWVRALEALANGCVLVSEHSESAAPLVPGEHFVSGALPSLGLLVDHLLHEEDRLRDLRLGAYDFVRANLTMEPAAQLLVDLADRVRRGVRVSARIPREAAGAPDVPASSELERPGEAAVLDRLVLEQAALARKVDVVEARIAGVDPDRVEILDETPSYAHVRPRVSVLVALYDRAQDLDRTLTSLASSEFDPLEVVVLDDRSGDGSADAARRFLARHPEIAAALLRHPVSRGAARTRNDLLRQARGELVLVLDAGQQLYPPAISRLVGALDHDPSLLFSYPILEAHDDGTPLTLRSYLPWEPDRIESGSCPDSLALLRREPLLAIGGYDEDELVDGREARELWRRCARRGLDGVLVPQILGRVPLRRSLQSARA